MSSQQPFLRWMRLEREQFPPGETYPYEAGAIRHIEMMHFHPKVTYIVGDNGVGKSTLIEALAAAWGFNPEGGSLNFSFATSDTHSELYRYVRLTRGPRKPKDGFFFRAETYYNVASYVDELNKEPGKSILDSYGGRSLHQQSHGESFFSAFVHRFGGSGLYILDEPEAALSPFRQMAMLSRIHQLVQQDSQFIIATHSPILMAYPDSIIYELSDQGVEECSWEETAHYAVTKQFMINKDRMLAELLEDDGNGGE